MSFFECSNLCKNYDSTKINLTFSAEKNSITTIVGKSGSGKSTVLKLIAGLIKNDSTSSKIILDNQDITNLEPGKRNLGMVFQQSSLFFNMTVQDNIAFGLKCNGMSKKESRIEASKMLEKFHLKGFEKRYPETLSGGESQRVALVRSLIVNPKLILFDEPLSALDAPLRKKLAADIKEMKDTFGFTAIMVTHDIEEAKQLSDNIIILNEGHKVWEGKPEDFSEELLLKQK